MNHSSASNRTASPRHAEPAAEHGREADSTRFSPSYRRSLVLSTILNIASVGSAAVSGVFVARELGPTDRGVYAAALAWYGVTSVLLEFGQSASTVYHISRDRESARDYVATSGAICATIGVAVAAIGYFGASILLEGSYEPRLGYQIAFVMCGASVAATSYVAALQAINITLWNGVRLAQPLLNLILVFVLIWAEHLTLLAALACLASTIFIRGGLSIALCGRLGVLRGKVIGSSARAKIRYGMKQFAASAPTALNARLDQVILSMTVPSAALGQYAVATSLTSLGTPFVAAMGQAAFPRIAASTKSGVAVRRFKKVSIAGSFAAAFVFMSILAISAPWGVPAIYGNDYQSAVVLAWILAPGGVLLASNQVMADMLSASGRPLLVARAQLIGIVITVVLVAVLIPRAGVRGAAVASSLAAACTFVFLLASSLRRPTDD
jgi:O-antigen/teichoic acid export membrane protein